MEDIGRDILKIARVFPRKTKATPDDELVYIGDPPIILPDVDEVHVTCTFSWDIDEAVSLWKAWRKHLPCDLGGPALGFDDKGQKDFVPGMYLKKGYVITSRGCNNNCWYCDVHWREGGIREIPITEGWNLLDNNILQCSEGHVRAVFAMLKRQKRRAELTGGLEARLLKDWHIDLLVDLKPKQMFFAYDKIEDFEPLYEAGRRLLRAGFTRLSHTLRCYVLIGYQGDTIEKAELRLKHTVVAGFTPMAMLWRDKFTGRADKGWSEFQRQWARPAIIHSKGALCKKRR